MSENRKNQKFGRRALMLVAVMVLLVVPIAAIAGTTQTFPDVPPDRWDYDDIEWANANGIMVGRADGNFYPDDSLRRGQAAALAHRLYDAIPAGAVGPEGPKGDTGADGAVGPAGPEGPKGDTGADGAVGPAGPEGPVGPKGADGADGADGAVGPAGPDGPKGADGADGAVGPVGPKGPEGADGQDGAPGADGPQGIQGEKGDPGVGGALTFYTKQGLLSGHSIVSCDPGDFATGGGYSGVTGGYVSQTGPVVANGSPTGWEAVFVAAGHPHSSGGRGIAVVICAHIAAPAVP